MRLATPIAAAAALSWFSPSALAQEADQKDKLTLNSGIVLTGVLDYITDEKVRIETDELDAQTIDWDDITNLESASFLLGTTDDRRFDVSILGRDGETIRIREGTEVKSIPINTLEEVIGGRSGVDWKGSIAVGAFYSTGNTDRRSANVSIDATRRTAQDRLIMGFRWNYEDTKDSTFNWVLTDRRTSGSLRYDWFLTDELFVYGRAAAESDFNAMLNLRYSVDAGLGYQIVDTSSVEYSIALGVGYIDSDYEVDADDSDSVTGVASHKFDWEIVEDLNFLHDASAIQSFDEKTELIVKVDTRLRWTMIDDLFSELQWLVDYNGAPATGTDKVDQRFFLNIGYSL